jgi:hypothetical protein
MADSRPTDGLITCGPRFGVVLRYEGPGKYLLVSRLTGGVSQLRISRFVNGTETVLASANLANPTKGVFFRLEGIADAGTIRLKLDGIQKLSVIDSTPASGSVGVLVGTGSTATSHRIDNVNASAQ